MSVYLENPTPGADQSRPTCSSRGQAHSFERSFFREPRLSTLTPALPLRLVLRIAIVRRKSRTFRFAKFCATKRSRADNIQIEIYYERVRRGCARNRAGGSRGGQIVAPLLVLAGVLTSGANVDWRCPHWTNDVNDCHANVVASRRGQS